MEKIFYLLVIKKRKKFSEVPDKFKDAVKKMLVKTQQDDLTNE